MIQVGDGARFAPQPFSCFRMAGSLDGQDLHRDSAMKPRVARQIDAAHAAVPEKGNHFIRADAAADVHVHEVSAIIACGLRRTRPHQILQLRQLPTSNSQLPRGADSNNWVESRAHPACRPAFTAFFERLPLGVGELGVGS